MRLADAAELEKAEALKGPSVCTSANSIKVSRFSNDQPTSTDRLPCGKAGHWIRGCFIDGTRERRDDLFANLPVPEVDKP